MAEYQQIAKDDGMENGVEAANDVFESAATVATLGD